MGDSELCHGTSISKRETCDIFLSYFGQDRELIYGMAASFGIHLEVLDLLARAAGRAILLDIVLYFQM